MVRNSGSHFGVGESSECGSNTTGLSCGLLCFVATETTKSQSDDRRKPGTRVPGQCHPQSTKSQSDDTSWPGTPGTRDRCMIRIDPSQRDSTFLSSPCDLHSPKPQHLGLASQAIDCRRFATERTSKMHRYNHHQLDLNQ